MANARDAVILGAGLAGLTLALDIKRRRPELSVTLIDKNQYPVEEATHKVGESTVEIGAHYLTEVLSLKHHFDDGQLRKFGLRMFFGGADPSQDLAEYDEIGASNYLPIPSYQIDRGRLENFLVEAARDQGVEIQTGSRIRGVELNARQKNRVTFRNDERQTQLDARWVVDASGRQRVLARQLDIREASSHRNAAVWMRVDKELDIDLWGQGEAWKERCDGRPRRLSTNHFMGPGYWVWLIPLASGATSIGLVFDPQLHGFTEVNSESKLLAWLEKHQPLVRRRLDDVDATAQDFRGLRHYAHSATQVFSNDGWAMTGDAGVFADPFYSPGNDFIAIANTMLADLICDTRSSREVGRRTRLMQQLYRSFFESTLSLYEGQYPGFGHADFMSAKTIWDYAYYWGVLAKLFFSGALSDERSLLNSLGPLQKTFAINAEVQQALRAASPNLGYSTPSGRFMDHFEVSLFHQLKRELLELPGSTEGEPVDIDVDQLDGVRRRVLESLSRIHRGDAAPAPNWIGGAPRQSTKAH